MVTAVPSGLEALLALSDGPWRFNETNHLLVSDEPDRVGFIDLDAHGRLAALAPDAVRLLIDMAASLDYGYFDRTTDTWRCAMCDAPAGHAEGCSHGEMLARFAALDQRAGTA
jgi:hypothetical protein